MFDLEPGKLIVIAIVALIAIPSKDLPRVLRTLGQFTGKMRRMASEFQGQFMEAMREAELDDLRKEVKEMKDAVKESVKLDGAFDPLTEARKQIAGAIEGAPPSHAQPVDPAAAPLDQDEAFETGTSAARDEGSPEAGPPKKAAT
ncbi:MAG: twin-arginine translocase TatA/TatE family subunit [Methylocystis sp.]|uniref:Sec-independent protein translocase subunit TatA/TatB n=1 Tax=Methylocystis sp. TaxID=1911079 RepID=UPI003D0E4B7C